MLLEKDLSRGCPNHHHSRAAILSLPFGDLVDELLSQLKLVRAGLDVSAAETLYVVLIEDSLHWLDLLERRFKLLQQIFLKHAGVHRSFVGRVFKNVPGAEYQILKFCQRHEVLNQGNTIVGSLAESNRSHLRQTTNRLPNSFLYSFHARDESGANCAEANQQHSQSAFWLNNLGVFSNWHYLVSYPTSCAANDTDVRRRCHLEPF